MPNVHVYKMIAKVTEAPLPNWIFVPSRAQVLGLQISTFALFLATLVLGISRIKSRRVRFITGSLVVVIGLLPALYLLSAFTLIWPFTSLVFTAVGFVLRLVGLGPFVVVGVLLFPCSYVYWWTARLRRAYLVRDGEVKVLRSELQQGGQVNKALGDRLRRWAAIMEGLKARLAAKVAELTAKEEQLAAKDEELTALKAEHEETTRELQRTTEAHDGCASQVASLEKELARRDDIIASMHERMELADQQLAEMREARARDDIELSEKRGEIRALKVTERKLRAELEDARAALDEQAKIGGGDAGTLELRRASEAARSSTAQLRNIISTLTAGSQVLRARVNAQAVTIHHFATDVRAAHALNAEQSQVIRKQGATIDALRATIRRLEREAATKDGKNSPPSASPIA
ncbi:hypothetical protein C8Q76DRAFT_688124 [Earliella scabrosa]|nr:hypothetical protein C8Q76DRAFT_688124 [Earliella scabrosa]